MSEEWRAVPGYEGSYEVSDQGRVRSLDRVATNGSRRQGKVLKQIPGGYKNWYRYVSLCRGSKAQVVQTHKLVLLAFVGPPQPEQEACHGLGGPADNRTVNLRWDTKKANSADQKASGTHQHAERHWNARLTRGCVARARDMLRCGVFQYDVAAWFGVSQSQISRINLGLRWSLT